MRSWVRSTILLAALFILMTRGVAWFLLPSRPAISPPPALANGLPPDNLDIKDAIIRPGDVVTADRLPNKYYVGLDNKRYVFTTEQTYTTWYPNATPVKVLERTTLETISLGGNVTHRPGMRIITFDTDPAYYVVAGGGVLRSASKRMLRRMYGADWPNRVDILPEYFRADYRMGEPVKNFADYSPTQEYERSTTISKDKGLTANLPSRP